MKAGRFFSSALRPSAFALIVLALLLAFLLYPRLTPRPSPLTPVSSEVILWTPPGPIQDASRLIANEFERRNPGIRVVLGSATTRDATGDPSRFLLGVAGGVPPDVILFDRFAIVEWASRGAFADLQPFADAEKADDPLAVRRENFFPPAWNEAVYQGRLYAIPRDADTRALFYNTNALVRAGLVWRAEDREVQARRAHVGEARPPQSWEELSHKRVDHFATISAEGVVSLVDDASIDLSGVGPNDVAVLVKGTRVFRARVAEVFGASTSREPRAGSLRLDLQRELPPNTSAVPAEFRDGTRLKIFDGNDYVSRLTRFDPQTGELESVGFIPLFGSSWFYLFGWQNGGEFMSADGTRCTLDDPKLAGALEWLVDVYDEMGGATAVSAVQSMQRSSANIAAGIGDPFLAGRVAMRVDADSFLRDIFALEPDFAFGVAPAPLPQSQRAAGVAPFGWGGGWAYAIPSTAQNKDAAWQLVRWMASPEANALLAEHEASTARANGRPYVPRLHADKRVLAQLRERYVEGSASAPATLVSAYQQFADLMPVSRYRPVTPVGQKLWNEQVRAANNAVAHTQEPREALANGRLQVQRALDEALHPPTGPLVPWKLLFAIYVAVLFLLFTVAIARRSSAFSLQPSAFPRRWVDGYLAASPWLLGFLVFVGGPILFSLVISFCRYDVLNPARFVGLDNYMHLVGSHVDPDSGQCVANDPLFWTSVRNTAFLLISIPLQLIAGLAIAMLFDAKVRGLAAYRTIYYLPAIVPMVAGFILWTWLFDPAQGLVNHALRAFGVAHPPLWLQDERLAKPSLILMGLWGVGGSMIIWLAGLKDIPDSLHEAASVDGANAVQRFFHVTLPLLTPTILFNLVVATIAVFQTFESAYVMTEGGPGDSTLFFAYKLFNESFRFLNMGTASAMAWILFVVVLAVTLLQLRSSRRWVHYGGA